MKVNAFTKLCIGLGTAALLATTVAVPAANADPATGTFGELVGLGSDTTQDVMNGVARAIGGGKVASYDAVGTEATVVTRQGGVAIPRGNGSGAGRDLLRVAVGQTPNATVAVPVGPSLSATFENTADNIQFARSSSGPGTAAVDGGVLTYIPFAVDAVTVAVDPTSPIAKIPSVTLGSSADAATVPSLYNIYRGTVKYVYLNTAGATYNSVGAAATGPSGTTAYKIQPLLPKAGSGTRSFFLGQIGLSETQVSTLKTDGVIKDTYGTGSDVQEHDGTALQGDAQAIVPFSIGQWVAQANGIQGVSDRRHGAQLLGLNGAAPTTGSGTSYVLNSAYNAMTRPVYNIVPSRDADNPDSAIAKTFVGKDSLVCSQGNVIAQYGFGQLTGAEGTAQACGNTIQRAYAASVSSVDSFSLAAGTVAAGKSVNATVAVTTTSNGGGTVIFTDGETELGRGTIARGQSSATIALAPTATGSYSVSATFVPALAGAAADVSETAVPLTVTAGSSTTTVSGASSATVGKSYSVAAKVTAVGNPGGTVTFYNGSKSVGKVTVAKGKNSASLKFVPTTASLKIKAVFQPLIGAPVAGSTSAWKTVKVNKATAKVAVAKVASVKAGKTATVKVTVSATGVKPTGKVTIKAGSKTLKTANLSNGKATLKISKLKKTTKITVSYAGSTTVKAAKSSTVSIKVTK